MAQIQNKKETAAKTKNVQEKPQNTPLTLQKQTGNTQNAQINDNKHHNKTQTKSFNTGTTKTEDPRLP